MHVVLAAVRGMLTQADFVTQRCHASSDLLTDVVAGEHVENGVEGTVECRQS